MRLVPEDNHGRIMFFRTHLERWMEHAAEIGTTPEEVALLQADFDEAQAAFAAHMEAQSAARTATARMNFAIEQMCKRGAAVVGQIRAAARVKGEGTYGLAMISPPDAPSPIAPPGKPQDFESNIDAVGWLTLRWKCKNPRGSSGTMYQVRRQLNGDGPFVHLATVGKKHFVDRGVPLGTKMALYEVQAVRSTHSGPTTRHSVYFGSVISEKQSARMFRPRDAA